MIDVEGCLSPSLVPGGLDVGGIALAPLVSLLPASTLKRRTWNAKFVKILHMMFLDCVASSMGLTWKAECLCCVPTTTLAKTWMLAHKYNKCKDYIGKRRIVKGQSSSRTIHG